MLLHFVSLSACYVIFNKEGSLRIFIVKAYFNCLQARLNCFLFACSCLFEIRNKQTKKKLITLASNLSATLYIVIGSCRFDLVLLLTVHL